MKLQIPTIHSTCLLIRYYILIILERVETVMIILAGTIGAGKTTLTKKLATFLNTKPFLEPVENNPILPVFYKGNHLVQEGKWKTNPYTFLLQIYFLNLRFRMIKQAMQNDNNVLDRSIYEDRLFMKMNYEMGNTTKEEWNLYSSLLKNMMEELPYAAHKKAPDLLVFLKISLPLELKHIKRRGRPYEQIDHDPSLLTYYKNLQKSYHQWYQDYDYSPKMVIDADQYDFVNNPQDLKQVLSLVQNKLKEIHQK